MREYEMNLFQVRTTEGYEWVAEFPDLKGCVGGGITKEEAMKEAEENKNIYLETLKDLGKKIPQPRTRKESKASGKLSLRLSKSLHKDLAEISNEEGISMNQYVIEAISEKIGKNKSTTAFEDAIWNMTEKIKFKIESGTYSDSMVKIRGVNFEKQFKC